MLQGIAKLELVPGETIALNCTTTRKENSDYSYYFLRDERLGIDGSGLYLSTDKVDTQVPLLLERIALTPKSLPELRRYYTHNITEAIESATEAKIANLNRRLSEFLENEKKYARLWAEGKLSN